MAPVKHRHPAWQSKIQLTHREFVQHFAQNLVQITFVKVDAADRKDAPSITLLHLGRQRFRLRCIRMGGVEQNHKGLSQFFQLVNDPFFRWNVIFAWYLADGSISRDDDADGRVVADDFPGSRLRRKVKGNLLLEPRAFHHSGLVVFLVAHRPFDHVPHAVDKPHPALSAAFQFQRHRFFRDEFRLGRHDGPPSGRLRQFVSCPLACRLGFDDRQHQLFHELFYQRAFSGPHRADHTNQDIAACPRADLAADCALLQKLLFFQIALPSLQQIVCLKGNRYDSPLSLAFARQLSQRASHWHVGQVKATNANNRASLH